MVGPVSQEATQRHCRVVSATLAKTVLPALSLQEKTVSTSNFFSLQSCLQAGFCGIGWTHVEKMFFFITIRFFIISSFWPVLVGVCSWVECPSEAPHVHDSYLP